MGCMPHDTVRPISAPRSALTLTFLFVLTVVASLALVGAPGHALPLAEDDVSMTVSSEIVVKEDETYTAKFTMSERGSTPTLSKSICNKETFDADESNAKDVTAEFKDEGDTRSCILQGSGSVSDSSSSVSHSGDEFTVTTPDFNDQSSSTTFNITQAVTFPGEVTEADGGKVDGTKVSFNDGDSHQVKGKDKAAAGATPSSSQESTGRSSSTPTWAWLLMGAIPAAAIGGGVAVAMSQRKKKQQTQFGPYATPAQGYDPNQAFFSQPDQPGQPYQQPYNGQPGQFGQPGQPYQPGDAGPAPHPYQQPYNGQPGQPYQPGGAGPAPYPYQQPYNGQPGQPYQPGDAGPAPHPYQQPYNGQPGQFGQPDQRL